MIDPFKEGEARTARMRTGISTFKEECARRGNHWIKVLMQVAIETKIKTLFGVDLDHTKPGNAASMAAYQGGDQSSQSKETDDAEG